MFLPKSSKLLSFLNRSQYNRLSSGYLLYPTYHYFYIEFFNILSPGFKLSRLRDVVGRIAKSNVPAANLLCVTSWSLKYAYVPHRSKINPEWLKPIQHLISFQ